MNLKPEDCPFHGQPLQSLSLQSCGLPLPLLQSSQSCHGTAAALPVYAVTLFSEQKICLIFYTLPLLISSKSVVHSAAHFGIICRMLIFACQFATWHIACAIRLAELAFPARNRPGCTLAGLSAQPFNIHIYKAVKRPCCLLLVSRV